MKMKTCSIASDYPQSAVFLPKGNVLLVGGWGNTTRKWKLHSACHEADDPAVSHQDDLAAARSREANSTSCVHGNEDPGSGAGTQLEPVGSSRLHRCIQQDERARCAH